jgi:hypothetical protein
VALVVVREDDVVVRVAVGLRRDAIKHVGRDPTIWCCAPQPITVT